MMTNEEALQYTSEIRLTYLNEQEAKANIDFILTVREALEKQIPKRGEIIIEGKPENGGSYGVRICPVCDKRIDIYGDYKGCPYCLQAVDWSEE